MKNHSTYSNMNSIATIGNTKTGHHFWVGEVSKGKIYSAGQTFRSTRRGTLKSIAVYPEIIIKPTVLQLTLHEFDSSSRTWSDKVAECKKEVNHSMERKWISFEIPNVQLDPNKQYAFKLTCNNGSMIAIAESHWNEKNNYKDGEQWIGSTENPVGNFHLNFDLSFIASIDCN